MRPFQEVCNLYEDHERPERQTKWVDLNGVEQFVRFERKSTRKGGGTREWCERCNGLHHVETYKGKRMCQPCIRKTFLESIQ